MAQIVTQLIVDSSGAKLGVAEFEAAMTKAKRAAVEGGEATATSFERAQARWTASLAKTDPVIKAQIAMERDLARQREINTNAVKLGITTQDAAAAQISKVTQQHQSYIATLGNVGVATQKVGTQTGLARHELVNLSRQAQDVGVSLASGQSPFTVLIQQGTQIADVFATSSGSVRGFFSQVGGWAAAFLKSTAGIVTAVIAIGGAAIYAASQFARASTTIEQALEEQNRLLKEGKALLDARTSAEAKAQLQSMEQTQFETLRNQLDLQVKLNQAMEDAANISKRRATRPTEVPNEMGIAPTGFAALSDPGLDKMTAAFEALKAAQAAGLPGLKEYNAELAKIGLAHPELALVVQDMIKAGEAGLQLENAAQRAKAMSDALAGIATNAQMAAVGLGSIAQFQVNSLLAEQAAAATERQALAVLKLAQSYPGISIEIAKQVEALTDSTKMIEAQKDGTEAATAAAIAYKNAIASGADEVSAAALESATLANHLARAEASSGGMADDFSRGANSLQQSAVSATLLSEALAQAAANSNSVSAAADSAALAEYNAQEDASNSGNFKPDVMPQQRFTVTANPEVRIYYPGGGTGKVLSIPYWNFPSLATPPAGSDAVNRFVGRGDYSGALLEAQKGGESSIGLVDSITQIMNSMTNNKGIQTSNLESELSWLNSLPQTIARDQKIISLQQSIDQLRNSTDGLNGTMQDALSPYYSQDPRTSHIGFRSQGMAMGGFVVPGAPSVNDNMMATFPVASGENVLYVDPQFAKRGMGGSSQTINVVNNINVSGNVDKATVNAIGRTAFQNTQNAARNLQAAQQ